MDMVLSLASKILPFLIPFVLNQILCGFTLICSQRMKNKLRLVQIDSPYHPRVLQSYMSIPSLTYVSVLQLEPMLVREERQKEQTASITGSHTLQ